MEKADIDRLCQAAVEVQKEAYAPYSSYPVGAAVLTEKGHIYTGCNVENMSFPVGSCAERNALATAVAAGERTFLAVAVAGNLETGTLPCGMCRQALLEFHVPRVYSVMSRGAYEAYALEGLLPHGFMDENIKNRDK